MSLTSADARRLARSNGGSSELKIRVPTSVPPLEGYIFDRKAGAFKKDSASSVEVRLGQIEAQLKEVLEMRPVIEQILSILNNRNDIPSINNNG